MKISVFSACSGVWGLLIGIFFAVASLLLLTSEFISDVYNRTSSNSASRKIEFLALIIPCCGVLALNQFVLFAIYSSNISIIDFTGLQWYWIIDGIDITLTNVLTLGNLFSLTVSNLIIITLVSTLLLTAVDVIHAVAAPTLGLKADAIPGRISAIRLDIELLGQFNGQCSELCGAMHGFMPTILLVVIIIFILSKYKVLLWTLGDVVNLVPGLIEIFTKSNLLVNISTSDSINYFIEDFNIQALGAFSRVISNNSTTSAVIFGLSLK